MQKKSKPNLFKSLQSFFLKLCQEILENTNVNLQSRYMLGDLVTGLQLLHYILKQCHQSKFLQPVDIRLSP